mgnify:CR=1 FL=1|tara:strand:+ start:196 stop:522 length:327 start_codon:yes stop_codon:yes gene_type:complete
MTDYTCEFNDSNFKTDVINSDKPVLVDFWAEWCGPCKMLSPTIDLIAKKYNGKIKVGKLNVDNNATIAQQYGVRSIPNILIFCDGEVKEQLVGNVPEVEISNLIDKLL